MLFSIRLSVVLSFCADAALKRDDCVNVLMSNPGSLKTQHDRIDTPSLAIIPSPRPTLRVRTAKGGERYRTRSRTSDGPMGAEERRVGKTEERKKRERESFTPSCGVKGSHQNQAQNQTTGERNISQLYKKK
ncbi:hypothetical protein NL108_014344 [Boleophthalmus pectinirostris]|nr:hypothetical protein NL108_014344 [Boleophthalmus pectinirostris]